MSVRVVLLGEIPAVELPICKTPVWGTGGGELASTLWRPDEAHTRCGAAARHARNAQRRRWLGAYIFSLGTAHILSRI